MKKKRNIVELAMHYRQIVILVVCCLMAFGIYSLPNMRKNEFPDFTMRQGIVVAVAPGNTAKEMEQQVAKPLENYIFTYEEVKKEKTYSMSRDGITYIMVQLNDNLSNKDEFWSKFKHGVQVFKNDLPKNVATVAVKDDFGDTSALLITMESNDKTYRELSDYMDCLQDQLRTIPSVGRMTVGGMQQEQIAVTLDNDRLARYGLNDQMLAVSLFKKGFVTTAGRIKNSEYTLPINVAKSLNNIYDIEQLIVYASPSGETVRLKDVASVRREYPEAESRITSNGKKCLLLSVEMKKGQNIVKMGDAIDEVMQEFQNTLPSEVTVSRITDQSKVVGDSVVNFLHEIVIAIIAVVLVVMLLLPMRVALVAASTIPITIFTSLGLYYAFDIELNTVTLAALIVTLGMIVDDAIVIIDNYLEQLGEGVSRWNAAINSATRFFKSVFTATLAISITFFPFLLICVGQMHDFLLSFPWAITIVLTVSLAVASLVVPFIQFWFIRKPLKEKMNPKTGKKAFSFLDVLQKYYDKLLTLCFNYPKTTISVGIVGILAGAFWIKILPQQMMPVAQRNQFAVEIYLPTSSSLEKTEKVADEVEKILRKDKRVVSVTSFKGTSSPRFHMSYAPQIADKNYAQFIVNTTGEDATEALLDEYADKYADHFPEAIVKFKQLSYSEPNCPIEIRLNGENEQELVADAEKLKVVLKGMPELMLVRTDYREPQTTVTVKLKENEASRLGITNTDIETLLAMRYGKGISVADVWEGDKDVPVTIKSQRSDESSTDHLLNEQVPVLGGIKTVPLRQVADLVPTTENGQIVRRNGVPTISILADLARGKNAMAVTSEVQKRIASVPLSDGVKLKLGGDFEDDAEKMPSVIFSLVVAAVMIFFIMLSHFHKINLSALIFTAMTFCLFSAAAGISIQGVSFGVTCVLGLVCLMGIIVRNGIIMYDYAEELRDKEKMDVRNAIWHSASRRMRPIFLTSAAASMGVVPMILGGSTLWMPMGTVIGYGALISMFFILTVLPVGYLLVFEGTEKKQYQYMGIEKSSLLKRLFCSLVLTGTMSISGFAQDAAKVYSLDECLSEAVKNNITLRNADNQIAMSAEQRKEAFTKFFPTVAVSGAGFMSNKGLAQMDLMGMNLAFVKNGIVAGVTAMQPVFAGGQIVNRNKLAKVGEEVSRLQRNVNENDIRLSTEQYYWSIVMLKEKLVSLDQLDKQLESVRKDAQAAVDAGVRNRNDLLQVQLRQNEVKTSRIQVENNISACKDLLAQMMGHPSEQVDVRYAIGNPELPQGLYQTEEASLPNTNEYQLLDKQIEVEKLQYKVAVGKNLPTVAVGGGYTYNDIMDKSQTNLMGMLTVSVPLSNWWGGSHNIKRQKMQVENAVNDKRNQGELLVIRMRKAWNDMNDAYKQVGIAQESITQSEENLRLNTDYYHAGTATITDLLDAQTLYQQSHDKYVEAFTNYEVKRREYLQATGR